MVSCCLPQLVFHVVLALVAQGHVTSFLLEQKSRVVLPAAAGLLALKSAVTNAAFPSWTGTAPCGAAPWANVTCSGGRVVALCVCNSLPVFEHTDDDAHWSGLAAWLCSRQILAIELQNTCRVTTSTAVVLQGPGRARAAGLAAG